VSKTYRKEIFNAMMEHGKTESLENIDFEWLAKKANIPVYRVKQEFKDLDDFYYNLSIEYWKIHEAKSKKIAQVRGAYALETLIRHDLNSIYFYLRDAPLMNQQHPVKSAAIIAEEYFHNRMASYYFDILRFNTELLPKNNMDIRIYSNFIVHSLFFLGMYPEKLQVLDENELKFKTRNLINSLFNLTSKAETIG